MEWPYRRFIKAFDAFQRRISCEELRARRNVHVAALYGNANLDSVDNDRPKIIRETEIAYERIIADIWNGTDSKQETDEAFESDFMRAGRKSAAPVGPPILPGEEVLAALPA